MTKIFDVIPIVAKGFSIAGQQKGYREICEPDPLLASLHGYADDEELMGSKKQETHPVIPGPTSTFPNPESTTVVGKFLFGFKY